MNCSYVVLLNYTSNSPFSKSTTFISSSSFKLESQFVRLMPFGSLIYESCPGIIMINAGILFFIDSISMPGVYMKKIKFSNFMPNEFYNISLQT